ncbi:MAG: type II secretion system GspH family protein [Candidatus Hydrogenedens sp.]|nr:type II secretion system GspH family protein [Candidatus Hydrogenedens sp.]
MKNKNKDKGFTLVELLVVMAIISILAAILVPNVVRYIARGRATRALGDIKGIELALTKMVTDANVQNLNFLFTPDAVREKLGLIPGQMTAGQFQQAIELYTRTLYALLREGRRVLDGRADVETGLVYSSILDRDVVMRLGVGYLEDLATDPWGNLYNIYPGPWTPRNGPIPFRIYMLGEKDKNLPGVSAGGRIDSLTILKDRYHIVDPETNQEIDFGYPADKGKIAYIWSNGSNLVSGQAIYSAQKALPLPEGSYSGPADYPSNQDEEYKGGGDDINNWDPGQSWMRFYS